MAKGRKTGGRQKGTPNRLTFQTRMLLFSVLEDELEKIPNDLALLDPKDRLEIVIKFLPYLFPKLTPTAAETADQNGLRASSDVIDLMKGKNEKELSQEQMMMKFTI